MRPIMPAANSALIASAIALAGCFLSGCATPSAVAGRQTAVAPAPTTDSIQLTFRTSEMLSLWYSIEAASGVPNRSTHLRATFDRTASDDDRQALQRTHELVHQLPDQLSLQVGDEAAAKERPTRINTHDILSLRALQAKDLEDFGQRILGLLPVSSHAELMHQLRQLQTWHRKHIWKQGQQQIAHTKAALEALAQRPAMQQIVAQTVAFYGAAWPGDTNAIIALVPVPHPHRGSTSYARSAGTVAFVEILQDDNAIDRFGVAVHELAHSLYKAQPSALQAQLEHWFLNATSRMAPHAYRSLNEALATAIGNGHTEATLRNQNPTLDSKAANKWYNNHTVDSYAKALFPSVSQYLQAQKTIDQAFVADAIETFETTFPKPTPSLVMQNLTLITDGAYSVRNVRDEIIKHVNLTKSQLSSPMEHPLSVDSYENTPS